MTLVRGPGPGIADTPRGVALLLVVAIVGGYALGGGARLAHALLTDTATVDATVTTAASFDGTIHYLHNDPTPPAGDTVSQADLSMTTSAPTATTLYNYDTDRDADAGRLVQRTGNGVNEANLASYQNWRGPVAASATTISGTVVFHFWSAMQNFEGTGAASVKIFLRDFNPDTGAYIEINNSTLSVSPWQQGSTTWVQRSVDMSVGNHTLAVGHQLELKVVVDSGSSDDLWFAYDTVDYPSTMTLP